MGRRAKGTEEFLRRPEAAGVAKLLRSNAMPEKNTIKRAAKAKRAGRAPSTQAGEFVHEEIEHIRQGKHGARSTKQAIAIGLSKARRAGVKLPPPQSGKASDETRRKARRDLRRGEAGDRKRTSTRRASATIKALKREGRDAASRQSLSTQARSVARRKSPSARSASARRAARTRTAA
jgi:hypothetical protein